MQISLSTRWARRSWDTTYGRLVSKGDAFGCADRQELSVMPLPLPLRVSETWLHMRVQEVKGSGACIKTLFSFSYFLSRHYRILLLHSPISLVYILSRSWLRIQDTWYIKAKQNQLLKSKRGWSCFQKIWDDQKYLGIHDKALITPEIWKMRPGERLREPGEPRLGPTSSSRRPGSDSWTWRHVFTFLSRWNYKTYSKVQRMLNRNSASRHFLHKLLKRKRNITQNGGPSVPFSFPPKVITSFQSTFS